MTNLAEILSEAQRSLVLFDDAAIRSVQELLTQKNGNRYIKCQIRSKEVQATPEEIIRQLWIHRLQFHYRYQMRCTLFHGELIPTKDAVSCYEPAFRLVRRFLECVT